MRGGNEVAGNAGGRARRRTVYIQILKRSRFGGAGQAWPLLPGLAWVGSPVGSGTTVREVTFN